ncbi:MAG: hypothetical protein ACI32N_03850 [Bulleidia sp.]
MHRCRSGSVLSDFLITMMIVISMACAVIGSLSLFLKTNAFDELIQDQIAIAQLRNTLMISDNVEPCSDTLSFTNRNRQMTLKVINGNLIIQPGTQIVLVDVDSASFALRSGMVVCTYERAGKQYEAVIALP